METAPKTTTTAMSLSLEYFKNMNLLAGKSLVDLSPREKGGIILIVFF